MFAALCDVEELYSGETCGSFVGCCDCGRCFCEDHGDGDDYCGICVHLNALFEFKSYFCRRLSEKVLCKGWSCC